MYIAAIWQSIESIESSKKSEGGLSFWDYRAEQTKITLRYQQQLKIDWMHMLKVKRNGEYLGIWAFENLGSRRGSQQPHFGNPL